MKFIVGGRMIDLERQDVIDGLQGKTPPVHARQRLFVSVNRKAWPVKAALCEATGLDKIAFPSAEAVRVLGKLGFPTSRRD